MPMDEKRVLIITLVILLLGFFSTTFTGLSTREKRTSTISSGISSEADYDRCEHYIGGISGSGEYRTNCDLNKDGIIDEKDLMQIARQASLQRPRIASNDCIPGSSHVSQEDKSAIVVCQQNEFGRYIQVTVPCPEKGMIASQTYQSVKTGRSIPTAYCDYQFSG